MTDLPLAIIDDRAGRFLVDATNPAIAAHITAGLSDLLGPATPTACANPREVLQLQPDPSGHVRISGYWHDSVIEGPGRRSVVRFQGCPLRCQGCYVPETHDMQGGYLVHIHQLADALLDPAYERNGVTILGGEPFAQPAALHSLIGELRGRQPDLHILVYSGFTLEVLPRLAKALDYSTDIAGVLASIDMLIDGRYIEALRDSAGAWTGSGNQRVLTRGKDF
jgi:anaerobic ribonucleoside-triphosphate reductase activating protein